MCGLDSSFHAVPAISRCTQGVSPTNSRRNQAALMEPHASQHTPFALLPEAEDEERVLDDDARGFGKADGDPDIRLLSRSDLNIESCVGGLELRVRVLRIQ